MILYADMAGGVAGDMILGAMVDCGLPREKLQSEIDKLGIPDLKIQAKEVKKGGFRCLKVDVQTSEEHHHRTFTTIKEMLEKSTLSDKVRDYSIRIFRRLAEAEGAAHMIPAEEVHFHEVGAADSIADIVGAAVGLEYFQADGFHHSDFLLGSGTIKCEHGIIPLPAPATLHLVKDFRFRKLDILGELTTPTGAAIITALSKGAMPNTPQIYTKFGLGAGSKEHDNLPGYFRLWLLQDEVAPQLEEIVIQANIDDMNPEIYPYLLEKLFEAGALDAYLTPVSMKKGRPGTLITITTPKIRLEAISDALFRQSTTIGLRWYPVNRMKLERGVDSCKSPWGEIRGKYAMIEGKKRFKPEFEECRRIAEEQKIPLVEVYRFFDMK